MRLIRETQQTRHQGTGTSIHSSLTRAQDSKTITSIKYPHSRATLNGAAKAAKAVKLNQTSHFQIKQYANYTEMAT